MTQLTQIYLLPRLEPPRNFQDSESQRGWTLLIKGSQTAILSVHVPVEALQQRLFLRVVVHLHIRRLLPRLQASAPHVWSPLHDHNRGGVTGQ